jgi:hypothetical protein
VHDLQIQWQVDIRAVGPSRTQEVVDDCQQQELCRPLDIHAGIANEVLRCHVPTATETADFHRGRCHVGSCQLRWLLGLLLAQDERRSVCRRLFSGIFAAATAPLPASRTESTHHRGI